MTNGTTMTNAVIECILSRSAAKYYDPAATLSDDQIRELVSGSRLLPGEEEPWGEFAAGLPKIKIAGEPDVDALKLAQEIRKRQAENEKFFRERAIAAWRFAGRRRTAAFWLLQCASART